jgi:Protein of unknown function (DUF3617)
MNVSIKVSAAAALFCACAAAGATDLPARKAGLWEMTVQSSNDKAGKPVVMQQCIDTATDRKMQQMSQGVSKDMCSKNELRSEGGGFTIDSVCKMGQSTATSKGRITGKFDSAYRVETKSAYNPPLMGMSDVSVVMDAKHLGACKADQKPGDMIMPGGMKMNIDQMPGQKK